MNIEKIPMLVIWRRLKTSTPVQRRTSSRRRVAARREKNLRTFGISPGTGARPCSLDGCPCVSPGLHVDQKSPPARLRVGGRRVERNMGDAALHHRRLGGDFGGLEHFARLDGGDLLVGDVLRQAVL